jgi:hypothetical protein
VSGRPSPQQRIGGAVWRTPAVSSAPRDLDVRLVPGRYRLWRGIANHPLLGMEAALGVTPPE